MLFTSDRALKRDRLTKQEESFRIFILLPDNQFTEYNTRVFNKIGFKEKNLNKKSNQQLIRLSSKIPIAVLVR